MKLKNILLILIGIFLLAGIFIYIEPSITGFVTQERFLVYDIKVSADKFDQEVKVEQFDDYEIKFDDALYYFVVEPEFEQEINYLEIEFMVDSSQIRDYRKEDVSLYYYKDGWKELEIEFVKQDGRFLYYEGKSKEFGLFAVAPKIKEKVTIPLVTKGDLVFFALIPLFVVILLFSSLSYGSIRLIQKINYRFYLLFKKGFVGLSKFVLSTGIVVLILSLLSPEHGAVEGINLIYYAVIPLIIFSLFTDVILNLFLYVRRLIFMTRVYKIFRNLSWLFVFVLVSVFVLLYSYVPKIEGSVTSLELMLYGLLPLIVISFLGMFVFYLCYSLVRRLFVTKV